VPLPTNPKVSGSNLGVSNIYKNIFRTFKKIKLSEDFKKGFVDA
jgi:hypothetical protein